ncbi:complement C3-like, partial [Etheostoma cragini]|uniref:complement C3-like n=1 Tax=Etheostoma cragini TaxID=417921 RepID=UPI00155E104C
MNTALSERGSLIIYLDKVSNIRPEEISFRIHQELNVDFTQPAAVSLYEYYDQKRCVRFYHPERTEGKLLRVCGSDACRCAEESCSMQNKANITNNQRTAKVCESTQTSIIDFAYKVRLESFTEDSSIDVYEGKVIEVIKEGIY